MKSYRLKVYVSYTNYMENHPLTANTSSSIYRFVLCFDSYVILLDICGTAKCENSAKCENAAKCEKQSTLNVKIPLNVKNLR